MTMLLGAAYYPEHRERSRWEYDLDNMKEAYVNCLRVGEFAWCRFEPEMGEFDFSWMDEFKTLASKRGIRLLMCPPLRTPPAWLVEMDPSVKLVRNDAVVLEFGSRYSFCINHPFLLERGREMAENMTEHYDNDPDIVGWHLDNEHGDEPDCHCPICRNKFQEWCRNRYGSIATLNKEWGMIFWGLEFNSFEQIPTPMISKSHHSPSHLLAWKRFRSDSTIEAVAMQVKAVRKYSTKEITSNLQGWNPRTDYYKMAENFDYCGLNNYPAYGEGSRFYPASLIRARGVKNGKNFHIHELRNGPHMVPGREGNTPAPGEVERLIMHSVGNGADGIFHFRWRACPFGVEQTHGAITDYDGHPKRIYPEVSDAFRKLTRISQMLEGSSVKSDTAILFDFNTWWVMGDNAQWDGAPGLYMKQFDMLINTLKGMNARVDSVGPDGDFSKYRMLLVPALACIDDALAEKFVRFVECGGTLVWHPLSGIKDMEAKIYPDRIHPKLKKLMGVDIREFATMPEGKPCSFEWGGKLWKGALFRDLPVLEGAVSEGAFADSWFAGIPAITSKSFGKGRVIYVATFAETDFYRALFQTLGVKPVLDNVPDCIELCERITHDGKRLVFVINTVSEIQKTALNIKAKDIYNDEDLNGIFEIAPFGTRILLLD